MKKRILLPCFLILFCILNAFSQSEVLNQRLQGSWLGKIELGISLRFVLKFDVKDSGITALLDSPDQGAKDIPMGNVSIQGDSVFIEAPALGVNFRGLVLPGDSTLDIVLSQQGRVFPFVLKHLTGEFSLNRPQEPKGPFPYSIEEVTIKNMKADVSLYGTLTIPKGETAFPAVILVSGSGPQNRDAELLGHKPFLLLADHLTRNGIAVLRYDDRGTYKSTGKFKTSTTFDFADDAEAIIDFLKNRKEIDQKKIGIIGHSEGGLVAPIIASRRNDLGYIILLAGPGIKSIDLMLLQVQSIDKVYNEKFDKTAEKTYILKKEYEYFEREKNDSKQADILKGSLIDYINNSKYFSENDKKDELSNLDFNWFKTFLLLNPDVYLSKVKCPVLALNGDRDLQVTADENLEGISKSLTRAGNKNFETKKFSELNHLFQHSIDGDPLKYGDIEETMSPEVLNYMINWLKKVNDIK